jgi:hypothetical protein
MTTAIVIYVLFGILIGLTAFSANEADHLSQDLLEAEDGEDE